MDTTGDRIRDQLDTALLQALQDLYDPPQLGRNPLVRLLGLQERDDPATALRNALVEAIGAIKPGPDAPAQTNAWRLYHILRQRYVETYSQRDIAANLSLSTRQLRRLHGLALQALGDYLWARYRLGQQDAQPGDPATPTQEQELEWLSKSSPTEPVDVAELVRSALARVAPLLSGLQVHVECLLGDHLPQVAVQVTSMRHALLNVLATASRRVPKGRIRIEAVGGERQVWMRVRAWLSAQSGDVGATEECRENLEIARRLIELSGATLEVEEPAEQGASFSIRLGLPVREHVTVLVIDDNADTLQLMERYLAGTRYRFVGLRDPQRALVVADEADPQIIVLDLMLPNIDGWELLGRLREHPRLQHTPILICSILPQEDLALAFGAAALIRKPVSRTTLLAALDQQAGLPGPGCP